MNKNIKVLLTGGTGMVGQNILSSKKFSNFSIIAPSRLEMDLFSKDSVSKFLKDNKPDLIIHAAGQVGGIQANIAEPVNFLVNNIVMGQNLLLSARELGIKKVINLSSSCVYPKDAESPLNEELILNGQLEPTNEGYALAKIATSKLCQYINKEDSNFQYKTIIPCNLFGPYDDFDIAKSHLLPSIILKIHSAVSLNHKSVDIWGDGSARREFMFVGDLADFILVAIKKFDNLPELMNCGLGYDHSVNDYYKTVASVIGWEGEFIHDLSKPEGMKRKMVDISLQNSFGWEPKVSLEDGIKETYEYYLKTIL